MPSLTVIALFLSLSLAAAVPSGTPIIYDNYKLFRIKSGRQLSSIRSKLSNLSLEPWNENTASHVDVAVSPEKLAAFEALKLDCNVMQENLGDAIALESASHALWERQGSADWYDSYHDYDDHIRYFRDLQGTFPNNSEWVSSGTSFEGRDIYGLHLWGAGGPGKTAVLYHGTVHAREWIATPVVEYSTLQLINGYNSGDNDTQAILDKYDFWIFPIVNPDGFVYTQTTDRLWRKNRQPPPPGAANASCIGRDINRNWEFAWAPDTGGSSSDPCSETYAGEAPSDSPENKGLDTLVRQLRDKAGIKLYIDWHSYGQDFLFPYGYNETIYLPQLAKWERSGSLTSAAIRDSSDRRITFTYGPGGAILYKSVGNSRDHVYAIGGADFSWTIELPDTGQSGFVLPPEQIKSTVEELWAGQQTLLPLLDEVFFDDEGAA